MKRYQHCNTRFVPPIILKEELEGEATLFGHPPKGWFKNIEWYTSLYDFKIGYGPTPPSVVISNNNNIVWKWKFFFYNI